MKNLKRLQERLNKRIEKRIKNQMKKKRKWGNLVLSPPKIEHYKNDAYDGYLMDKKTENCRRRKGIGITIKPISLIKPRERK